MYAASVGHDTLVNLLLEAHVDPNKCSLNGLTPLMVASGCGNESVCYFLLQVSHNACNNKGNSCSPLPQKQCSIFLSSHFRITIFPILFCVWQISIHCLIIELQYDHVLTL